MKIVVIFNAPPNAGKDKAAEFFEHEYKATHLRFKTELYKEAAATSPFSLEQFIELCTSRHTKDTPMKELGGRSPRQHLIHRSEEEIKPVYGKDYFGKKLASQLPVGLSVVSDGGFVEELLPVLEKADVVYVVRMSRDGCSFDGDSRNYIPDEVLEHPNAYYCDVDNSSDDLEDLYDICRSIYDDVFDVVLQEHESLIFYNAIQCPDGTIIESKHRHDFVSHLQEDGREYFVDGGKVYLRRGYTDLEYTELAVTSTSPHKLIREHFVWGSSLDKDGNEIEPIVRKLKELDDDHIVALIEWTSDRYHPLTAKAIRDEWEYRKNMEIVQ